MNSFSPIRRGSRSFWLIVGLIFFVFLYLIKSILLPFILGILIAYFLDPAADKLEEKNYSRSMATSIIIGVFFSILIAALVIILPVIAKQLAGFIDALPGYIENVKRYYASQIAQYSQTIEKIDKLTPQKDDGLKEASRNVPDMALKYGTNFIAQLYDSGKALVNVVSLLLITPIVAFYLLRDWDRIVAHVDSLLPREHAETIREQMRIIDRTLAGFVRGQINVCMILGTYYAIGLSLVGLKFGLLIGVATGFLVIFPYVGLMLGMGIGLGVAFFQFDDPMQVGLVLAVFVSGQVIEGYFITPKLIGEKVGLHPVWIIFGMLAGAALFGFVGILLAIPITAIVGVLIRFAVERYKQSEYYQGNKTQVIDPGAK